MAARGGPRIVIVGPTCSGKSTLAAHLSAAMGVRCIEMDDMVWSPRWVRVDKAGAAGRRAFRERCAAAVSDEAWVCAGAWSSGRDLVLARAETVVSLDLGLWCIFVRMLGRTAWRCWSQQPVCNGNYETLASAVFGAHSIFRYFWKQWPRRRNGPERRQHLEDLRASAPGADILYFTTPEEVERWATGVG
eukprot:g5739.t1